MEVKIKYNIGYVDADWTIENGVMVVSPKEKFEPKDGEIVTVKTETGCIYICFFKGYVNGGIYSYGGLNQSFNMFFDGGLVCCSKELETIYPASEEEKKGLFGMLAEAGWEWCAERKILVKLKWKPKYCEVYWTPYINNSVFVPIDCTWTESASGNARYEKGWCFKTKEECQEFCNRLNQAIEGIKP